ncbi:unnamed protein product [Caenorhabditis sp. 36 PRJEB53466]|nr:unnamed protein product [Caenorhabditis sp. 36 PRJEB53466]
MEGSSTVEMIVNDPPSEADELQNVTDPSKGVKRVANSPPEKEAKKPKNIVQLSSDSSPTSSIELTDGSPQKDASTTPKTPRTPKITREEREKLRKERMEEREKQRAERERILEEKRLEKEKAAEEKRMEKEKKEKERLEKKLEEDRKKEEKRREAEEKKKKEEEEKLKKEEEKLKKKREEEERKEAKRKEEEEKKEAKRKEEEAIEEKKRRESARFLGFFSKVEKKKALVEEVSISTWYRPFELKDGMTLAPIRCGDPVSPDFDFFANQDLTVTIAKFLETAEKPVFLQSKGMRAKLFQFHDNRRPPYFGTWRKKAKNIKGWLPFGEENGLDYEADSDDEWEEEPDGDECDSDDDNDKEEEGEEDEDDGFFVPPCYLSDGEGEEDVTSDTEGSEVRKAEKKTKRITIDSDGEHEMEEGEGGDAEDRKARLAARASEWSKRTEKKKVKALVPRAVGPEYVIPEIPAPEFKFMGAINFY